MGAPAERFFAERHVVPDAVRVPDGYTVEVVATGLDNPSAFELGEDGSVFLVETGSMEGSDYDFVRVTMMAADGYAEHIAEFDNPITGLAYHEGTLFVMETGEFGRVHWLDPDGSTGVLVDGIPGGGDNPSSDIIVSRGERLYFAQGTRTNSGVAGADNNWLGLHPDICDIPAQDVVLTGMNFTGANPFGGEPLWTSAFKPFGFGSYKGERVEGVLKATGCVYRCELDGGGLEVVAWGLHRPIGMASMNDGRIFCTDAGMEDKGGRRISQGGEYLHEIQKDAWYGWPDYQAGIPVTQERFRPDGGPQPSFVMQDHPSIPPRPVAAFPLGYGLGKIDFPRSPFFAEDSSAFIPICGDKGRGCRVIACNVEKGGSSDFAVNKKPGPASSTGSGGMEHPVAVRFDRTGESMYILDCGITTKGNERLTAPQTGVLWRVRPLEIS